METLSPEAALDGFIDRFMPDIAALGRDTIEAMRARLPGAVRMVYDNYNALVVGFCPGDRPSDAIFSIALFPRSVALCFLQGAGLADPHGLLRGSGTVARHLPLESAADLDRPEVEELVARALAAARVPLDSSGEGRLVIRSISARQRPRRPAK
jgi:hypothetical protein